VLAAVVLRVHPEAGRPKGDGWARCCEERTFIRGYLDRGVRLTKIRKLLLRLRGVHVSYPTLWRFAVVELGFGRKGLTIPVADCGPGEEVQLDTGWVGWLSPDAGGRRRRFRAFIFTGVFSRYRFVYPAFRETTTDWIEACEAAWRFFGGIFKTLIVDNPKAIVQDPDALHPKINAAFFEYAQARGFILDTTRVRKPRDKARVERAVRSVRDDCFGGEALGTIEEARMRSVCWCRDEYGLKRHGTTQRLPRQHFEAEEQNVLRPAPVDIYDIPLWRDVKVARDQHAQVAKALYSLPTRFVGRTLRARADRSLVRFYDRNQIVKTHPRVAPGRRSTDRNDFPTEKTIYALRDVNYLAAKAMEQGPAVGQFAKSLLDTDLPWTRMRQVFALLGLARRYGAARTNDACQIALAAEMINVHRLRKLLEIANSPTPSISNRVVPIGRFLRPATQYALPFTSHKQEPKGERI
jgi:hypothetical protein